MGAVPHRSRAFFDACLGAYAAAVAVCLALELGRAQTPRAARDDDRKEYPPHQNRPIQVTIPPLVLGVMATVCCSFLNFV